MAYCPFLGISPSTQQLTKCMGSQCACYFSKNGTYGCAVWVAAGVLDIVLNGNSTNNAADVAPSHGAVRGIATPSAAAKADNPAKMRKNRTRRYQIDNDAHTHPRMTRPILEIPDDLKKALDDNELWERYHARPPYQQNNYVGWIVGSKRVGVRAKRLAQLVSELQAGGQYMGSIYIPKR
jgi:hypothetical protein